MIKFCRFFLGSFYHLKKFHELLFLKVVRFKNVRVFHSATVLTLES